MYIHELPDWPEFKWNQNELAEQLASVRHEQGRLIGRMETLGFKLKQDASLQTLVQDVLSTSEIEGQILNRDEVRSSLARRLGIKLAGLRPSDRKVDGVVGMLIDATQKYQLPLTKERLFGWQAALFPTGWGENFPVKVGGWRDDQACPMQVVSGFVGKQRVHFQAPSAVRLEKEMTTFLAWFDNGRHIDPVVKSALAHLWFVTIHPFDDGNGRVARAIADMQLARSEGISDRFYSMSAQISADRKNYYEILERTQKGNLNVTAWLKWYLDCLQQAIEGAQLIQQSVLRRARFWESVSDFALSERQRKVIAKLLDDFESKLTTTKWAKLARCSQDTAHRDITDLVEQGILRRDPAGGRSTSYSLVEP